MTNENEIIETKREELLRGLQGYLKDWAIVEPETSLILGNVRRMLNEIATSATEDAKRKVIRIFTEWRDLARDQIGYLTTGDLWSVQDEIERELPGPKNTDDPT